MRKFLQPTIVLFVFSCQPEPSVTIVQITTDSLMGLWLMEKLVSVRVTNSTGATNTLGTYLYNNLAYARFQIDSFTLYDGEGYGIKGTYYVDALPTIHTLIYHETYNNFNDPGSQSLSPPLTGRF